LQLKTDINFATSTPLTIVLPALVAKFLRRTPYVFEVRDLWPEIPIALGFLKGRAAIFFAKKLAGLAYKHASKIVVLSRDMGKGVLIYGDYEKKMVLIPNASDVALLRTKDENAVLSFWQQRNLDSRNASLVVYTGTLGRVNQVGYLVDLAAESCIKQADNIKFVVFGDGAEKEIIIKAAKDKKVWNDNFFLFSPVSKKELAYVLGGASLSISLVDNIPILWGNSANKFFDAFAAGVPVGVNHGGWQAEVIQEFSCGLVLDYNVAESAKSLLSFLSDKDRLVQAKVQSARLGDNVYSRDVLYDQLRTVFSEVRV
jgi:glycosyltransferase involved in cell wall biosynthesis